MGAIERNEKSRHSAEKRMQGESTVLRKWSSLPLRKFFILTVLLTFSVVALLSGLIIWGCAAFRKYLLPDSDSVYLSLESTYKDGNVTTSSYLLKYDSSPERLPELQIVEDGKPVDMSFPVIKYSVTKIQSSFDSLTPKRRLAYRVCGIMMAAAPVILSLGGILICSFYFYRRKLQIPLKLLSEAAGQIAVQDLDFSLEYDCEDEMGELCRSFSRMQTALSENYKKLWIALEERKKLQASVAHDLRNPLAVIRGYTEYLEEKVSDGELKPEKALRIARNLNAAAIRMERYTESIRTLNQLEDMEPDRKTVSASRLAANLAADLCLLAGQKGRTLLISSGGSIPAVFAVTDFNDANMSVSVTEGTEMPARSDISVLSDIFILPDISISADTSVIYRVLENIVGNSLRFSEKEIFLEFSLKAQMLSVTVRDDGKGFSPEILQKMNEKSSQYKTFCPSDNGAHMGIGLAVSRILCQKHGGALLLSNSSSGGAVVKISFAV